MSNQRFPRSKYVRALIRIENELLAWAGYLDSQAQYQRPRHEFEALSDRARELRVLAADIHTIADSFGGMPLRMRELVARAMDKSRD